jgi:hypothetical protein
MKKRWFALMIAVYLCVLLAVWLSTRWRAEKPPWRVPEEPPTREALLAIASDPQRDKDARSKAIFRLFAEHIPPNASASTIRKVFGECEWINETRIVSMDVQTGQGQPLWTVIDGTLFCLDLFTPDDVSDWYIYVRLSDAFHSVDDVRRLFNPKAQPDPKIRLVEFALGNRRTGHQEVFDATGRHPPRDP